MIGWARTPVRPQVGCLFVAQGVGSTREARGAGIAQAASATSVSTAATAGNVAGSWTGTANTRVDKARHRTRLAEISAARCEYAVQFSIAVLCSADVGCMSSGPGDRRGREAAL